MNNIKRYPFTNDYVFKKTLTMNKHIAQRIVKIVTGNDVEIEQLGQEEVINPSINAPSVKYDVLLLSKDNSFYDLEMQNYNFKDLLLRTRYYVSCNDIEYENKYRADNDKFTYNKLPNIYIIFICTYDPFLENKLIYHAKETIYSETIEKENIISKDKNYTNRVNKIFINASYKPPISYNKDTNKDLLNLIQYINTNIPCDNLTNDINNYVNEINKTERGVLMDWQQHIDEVNEYFENEGIKKGIEKGKAEGLKEGIEQGKSEAKKEDLIATIQLLKTYCKDVNELYSSLKANATYKDYPFNEIEAIYNRV